LGNEEWEWKQQQLRLLVNLGKAYLMAVENNILASPISGNEVDGNWKAQRKKSSRRVRKRSM